MNGKISDKIAELCGRDAIVAFKPLAYYNSHMDCIRVELRDCSITEKRQNEVVTFLYDNYPSPSQSEVAGIMIKGIKHLFATNGMSSDGIIYLTAVLNCVAQQYPDIAEEKIMKLINELNLTVDMSEREFDLVEA